MFGGLSFLEFVNRGGPLMWVLLVFSCVAVSIVVERSLTYAYFGFSSDPWLKALVETLKKSGPDQAISVAKACHHPVARVVQTFLEERKRPTKVRQDNVRRAGSLALESAEKHLRILAALAHLSPLVGLLGTVQGMVQAFAKIQAVQGTIKPSDLAGGIWEALLTTVFGLLIAIPCMAIYHAFEGHADKIARRMEWAVTTLDDYFSLSSTSIQERTSRQVTDQEFSTIQ